MFLHQKVVRIKDRADLGLKTHFYMKHVHLKFLGFKYEVLTRIEKWLRMNI